MSLDGMLSSLRLPPLDNGHSIFYVMSIFVIVSGFCKKQITNGLPNFFLRLKVDALGYILLLSNGKTSILWRHGATGC
jgi:hypothetical protein